jgi:hypothetical protein
MSSCNFEDDRLIIDESGLDERRRKLIEFAADLVTPFHGTAPARPNAEGVIDRPIAADVSPAFLQKLAELATGNPAVA